MAFLVGTLEPEAGQGNKMQTILDRTTLTEIGLVGESFMCWVVNSFGIIAIKPFSVSGQFQLYKGTATGTSRAPHRKGHSGGDWWQNCGAWTKDNYSVAVPIRTFLGKSSCVRVSLWQILVGDWTWTHVT